MAGTNAASPPFPAARSRHALLRWLPWIFAAAYLAVMMPVGGQMILHYPDERHYAFGGASMVETGDWLIPRTPAGEVRLKKPVLPYWFSAAGFEVAGVGAPGFRLFWVLGACAILLMTFAITALLGAAPEVAFLAEIMLAANPVFLRAAINAIPDIPLALFTTLAARGFARVIGTRDREPASGWGWLSWTGIALAVLAKGLLPVVLIATLVAYVLAFDRSKARAVFRPLPVLFAVTLVASWYAYAAISHPSEFVAQFFGDQVTGNATKSAGFVFVAFAGFLAAGVFSFLGWPILLGWLAARSGRRIGPSAWPPQARLLALWCAVILIVFSFGDAVDPRYLLPAMPLFAALVAAGIGTLDGPGLSRTAAICRVALIPALAVGLILAAPEAAILLQMGRPFALALLVLGLAAWVTLFAAGWLRPRIAPYLLAATPILALALAINAMAPVVLPDRGTVFAAAIARDNVPASRTAFIGDVHTASEIRLATGTTKAFVDYRHVDEAIAAGHCLILTTRRSAAHHLTAQGFTVTPVRGGWRDMGVGRFLQAVANWRVPQERDKRGARGYLATCHHEGLSE